MIAGPCKCWQEAREQGNAWLELAAELDDLHLDEDVESGLSTHARDALVAARALKAHMPSIETPRQHRLGLDEDEEGGLSENKQVGLGGGMREYTHVWWRDTGCTSLCSRLRASLLPLPHAANSSLTLNKDAKT